MHGSMNVKYPLIISTRKCIHRIYYVSNNFQQYAP